MGEKLFKLHSVFDPAGDQPKAIRDLTNGLLSGLEHQTLLGVTGSGKTLPAIYAIFNAKSQGKRAIYCSHALGRRACGM